MRQQITLKHRFIEQACLGLALFYFNSSFAQESQIDIVIPVHNKDQEVLEYCIKGAKENVADVGTVYVVSEKPMSSNAIWIDEKRYPFSKIAVGEVLGIGAHERCGWYFQQLLKLYAPQVIEGLSENFLILDSDTIFLLRAQFVRLDGKLLFHIDNLPCSLSTYTEHMHRLLPSLYQVDNAKNPVVHHMLFTKTHLKELFTLVEEVHHMPFWKAFLTCIDKSYHEGQRGFYVGASEYTIYYHYMKIFHGEKVYEKVPLRSDRLQSLHHLESFRERGFDLVSAHDYFRSFSWGSNAG